MIGMNDCTPGYYNNEGQPAGPGAKYAVGHPAGPSAYFQYIDAWRKDGKFDGLEFR
jgi:cyclohexanone monooxygenase